VALGHGVLLILSVGPFPQSVVARIRMQVGFTVTDVTLVDNAAKDTGATKNKKPAKKMTR
jgi:hypothetical protein